MDENNPVVKLCAEGMQAEGEGRPEVARELYERAWAMSNSSCSSVLEGTACHVVGER